MGLIISPFHCFIADPATLGYIAVQVVIAAIGTGVSLLIGALTRPKQQQQVPFPPNDVTRGGYLPVVIGRRQVGCHICWIGVRQTHPGGSGGKSGSATGSYYTESAMHGLCHGPVRKIIRMWSGNIVFWYQTLDSTLMTAGSTITLPRQLGNARVYFGKSSLTDQPADAQITLKTGKASAYPGLCYLLWYLRNLGGQTSWPPQAYEVETRPSDIAAACGLDLSFLGVPDWIEETNAADSTPDGVVVWVDGKTSVPAGTYTITYLEGAYKLAPNYVWQVHSQQFFGEPGFTTPPPLLADNHIQVVKSDLTAVVECPGNNSGYASQDLAEAANVGANATFSWPGGPMGILFRDTAYFNQIVPGTPNPTYSIIKSDASVSHTVSITVNPGAPGSGDMGANPMAALYILLCAPFPYGCGIPTTAIDTSAMAAAAAQLDSEHLAVNILVDDGKQASDAVASLMSDIGMLLPQIGGKLTPYLIRAETTVPELTPDLTEGGLPETQILTAPLNPDRYTFTVSDALNNYAVSDVTVDDDAQADFNRRPQAQNFQLANVVSRSIAYTIGLRRAAELSAQAQKLSAFPVLREARNPAFHPGRSFTMNDVQYRITGWKPDAEGVRAQIEAVLDQYGTGSSDPGPGDGGWHYPTPVVDGVEVDIFFVPFILPRAWRVSLTTPLFGVGRIRGNDSVNNAQIWISTSETGTYTLVGNQDAASAGGVLVAPGFDAGTGLEVTGPKITPDNLDITTAVVDLTGDAPDYNAGAQTAICELEIALLESVTANLDGTYTLNNVTRGAYFTTVAAHANPKRAVIVEKSSLSSLFSALLIANQGGTLWIKTQPSNGTDVVDLSLVTPQPLYVPVNLIATITITNPTGGEVVSLGSTTAITWQTSSLTGNLKIEFSEDDGSTWSTLAASVADTGSYSWNTTGLTASTTCLIRISSVLTPEVQAITYPFTLGTGTAPSTPTGLIAIAGEQQVALNWPAVTGATAYNVKRGSSGGPYTTIATIVSEAGGVVPNSYVDAGLTNGTTYCYVVSALIAGVESSNTAEACATPFHCDCGSETLDCGSPSPCGHCNDDLEVHASALTTRCMLCSQICIDIGPSVSGDSGTFTDSGSHVFTWMDTGTTAPTSLVDGSLCDHCPDGLCTGSGNYISVTRTA